MGEDFEQWIDFMYGEQTTGKIKSVRGKVHEFFSMNLYYTTKGEVKMDMQKYVKKMIHEFPINIKNPRQ